MITGYCPACGAPVRNAEDAFCGDCGAPLARAGEAGLRAPQFSDGEVQNSADSHQVTIAPSASSPGGPAAPTFKPKLRPAFPAQAMTAGFLIAILVLAGIWWWRSRDTGPTRETHPFVAGSTTASSQSSDPPNDPSSAENPAETSTSAETSTPANTRTEALSALEGLRAAGVAKLRYDDHWVAQLASKYEGVTDIRQTSADGRNTFYLPDILAEHEALRSRFGADVMLIGGQDMGKRSTRTEPLWTTIYDGRSFENAAAVTAWCQAQFPQYRGQDLANVCLPRRSSIPHA